MYEGEISCGLFLDFSKAFDTVDHDILIHKLEYYGIRCIGEGCFSLYLKSRKQMVTENGVTSDLVTVPCGIPHGSVLGLSSTTAVQYAFHIYFTAFHCFFRGSVA